MTYEPEKLKAKKGKSNKRVNLICIVVLLAFLPLFFAFIELVVLRIKDSIISFITLIGGLAILTILYFLVIIFICLLILRGDRQFITIMNRIINDYLDDKNAEHCLERLFAIDIKPKTIDAEITWYKNVAMLLGQTGKIEESIALYEQLAEIGTKREKEFIQRNIKCLQERLEKGD